MTTEANRAEELGLTSDELAFVDAIRTHDSVVIVFAAETPKAIAHELVEIIRRDAKTDWAVKERVRAKLRATIKRLLRKYGYPPDHQEGRYGSDARAGRGARFGVVVRRWPRRRRLRRTRVGGLP